MKFKRRFYDPQTNQPSVSELYITISAARWPVDFSVELLKQYFPNSNSADRMHT
ncbi:MAG: hypothetical protein HY517_04605 [Candidatus Aenigmarchaeota archaeon]|nr:hypothetical protein [Candidatus Aenigmarchaeota archaeon]